MDPSGNALEQVDVAIVGGGFSGTMVAANLLLEPGPALTIALIDPRPLPGRGVAYGTPVTSHRLNVPAAEMSAWCGDESNFIRWLHARGEDAPSDLSGVRTYAPRGLYGAYVEDQLRWAVEQAGPGRHLIRVEETAVGLLPAGDRFRLRLASGRMVSADRVVLAIGQFPPAPLRVAAGLEERPWYVDDPWSAAALTPLPPAGSALLVGTGLTAVDVAVALLESAPETRVHLVSRRAQLPAPQRETQAHRDWLDPATAPRRVSELARLVRREVAAAEAEGGSWLGVVDALKPHASALWTRLPLVERRRFLRHARSYWEAHRNRLPPPTAARVAGWIAEGRLVVHAGRLNALEDEGRGARVTVAARGGPEATWRVDRVINCTGPDTQYRQINHPLVLDLLGTGLARPDPLGLGLDVAADGRLKDEDGLAEKPLYTLGWPRQGQLWDATTVPSLREQARDVARRLLDEA